MLGSRASKPNDAAKLFGFGDAANEREGFEVLPSTGWWWKLHDDLLAALGVEEFEQLRALGRALDDDQAVTDARLLLEEVRAAASID